MRYRFLAIFGAGVVMVAWACGGSTANNGGGSDGIYVAPRAALVGAINRTTMIGNAHYGLSVFGGNASSSVSVLVSAVHTLISNNGGGVFAGSQPGGAATTIVLDDVAVTGNSGNGLWADSNGGGATTTNIRLTQSVISGNQVGAQLSGGTISTLGNNTFTDNSGGNVSGGSLTSLSLQ